MKTKKTTEYYTIGQVHTVLYTGSCICVMRIVLSVSPFLVSCYRTLSVITYRCTVALLKYKTRAVGRAAGGLSTLMPKVTEAGGVPRLWITATRPLPGQRSGRGQRS